MNSKIVIVSCTNVGRHLINFFLNKKKFKGVKLAGVLNLDIDTSLNKSNYDSYYDLKKKYNLNIKYIKNINDTSVYKWLKKIRPSLIVQSGWSQKFSKRILELPRYGCIGQHPAPLPIGRGAACVNWAIILGYKTWGDSFFLMDEKFDNGDVVGQEKLNINPEDDVKIIYDKVCFTSKKIFSQNISKWVKGKFNVRKQNKKNIIYFKRRTPKDGKIDTLKDDNLSAYNKIRALTRPYPGAYIIHKNKKIYIWKSKILRKSIFKDKKISKKLFIYNKKLVLMFGKLSKSFLQLERINIENSPDFQGYEINKYFKIF
ncbi:methionyl-tRNA formyltransferase [Candidatus Pelagibacter sp.]|uniref:methionyl-tRNA formyltransferase n=1 Tax=Candidatus Pelagibacter sp. TaxID=2024849 RepID=UPI003F85AE9E